MAETPLEMAKRHLRESEELVVRQRDTVAALEHTGDQQALREARARLYFLEAARDAHRALLARQSGKEV
jgi:ribosomal protein S18 acetylase RimI-like enzyme